MMEMKSTFATNVIYIPITKNVNVVGDIILDLLACTTTL
jgi:hypothetical protein